MFVEVSSVVLVGRFGNTEMLKVFVLPLSPGSKPNLIFPVWLK